MDNKQLIIIVAAIIVAGCIVACTVLFSSSDVESVNDTVANNITNVTNSSLVNNTTSEVVGEGSGQSSQSNNHAQQSQNPYRSSSYQNEPFEEGYGTDEYYASHGFKQDKQGGWTDKYGNPAA